LAQIFLEMRQALGGIGFFLDGQRASQGPGLLDTRFFESTTSIMSLKPGGKFTPRWL